MGPLYLIHPRLSAGSGSLSPAVWPDYGIGGSPDLGQNPPQYDPYMGSEQGISKHDPYQAQATHYAIMGNVRSSKIMFCKKMFGLKSNNYE